MANFSELKTLIDAYVNRNGVQAITGSVLNGVLNQMVDQLGRGYEIVGVATHTTDPGQPDGPQAWIASDPGTYSFFGGLTVADGEVAFLSYDTGWHKDTIASLAADATVDASVGTPSVNTTFTGGILTFEFSNLKGETGAQGPVGVTSVQVSVDNTTGDPACDVSLQGQTLVLAFSGLKGAQGDTGVSADFPITIANNLTTDDPTAALSAAQGVVLEGEITTLEDTVNGSYQPSYTPQALTADKYYNLSGTVPNSPSTLAGCYCVEIAVTEGEVYRVSGYRNSNTASRLWATADSGRDRVRYASTVATPGRATFTITINAGESYLFANLKDYDADQGDGVWKVTQQWVDGLSDQVDDLDNRVTALEGQSIPSVVDSLTSTSTTDALSANQGRVLNEDVNGVTTEVTTELALNADKYFNTNNSRVPTESNLSAATGTYCCYVYPVQEGEVYRIYGKGDSGAHQLYALADADRYVIAGGTPGAAMNTRTNGYDLTIPAGVARLVVNLYQYNSTYDKVLKVDHVTSQCVKSDISDLQTSLAQLYPLALPLKDKKVMFFGDSITDYTYNGWGLVGYFRLASLANCYKAAIGGTRFCQRATPVDTPTTSTEAYAALDICNMVKAWCEADYTKQDAATTYLGDHAARVTALKDNPIGGVDIVCIGGGTNDMTANSPIGSDTDNTFDSIKGALNKMVELLLTANPKLKIYFYSPVVGYHGAGGRTDANWDDNHQFNSGLTKPEYIDIFAARARANHIPYINLYWTLGWNQTNFSEYFLDSDDHHPYKGFDVIGRRLYQQVVNNLE